MNDFRRRQLKRIRMRIDRILPIALVIIVIAFFAILYCREMRSSPRAVIDENMLTVRYFDVGQGDCALISFPVGNDILIDSGPSSSYRKLISEIKRAKRGKIEYFILTHFDEDHIGGADEIFASFDIGTLIIPQEESDSLHYLELMKAYEKEDGCVLRYAVRGDKTEIADSSLTILFSRGKDEAREENDSVVAYLEYGENSFLFMGDLEEKSETELISALGGDFDCDVLTVAHHGSSTSTSDAFLDFVKPRAAVISCGKDNPFGHPNARVLEALEKRNVVILRTDESGTIILQSDKKQVYQR